MATYVNALSDSSSFGNRNYSDSRLLEELEVLISIYIDDLVVSQDDDGRTSGLSITLHPSTAEDTTLQYVCVTLDIKLPHGYPDALPCVSFKTPRGLSDKQLVTMEHAINTIADESIGHPMLYEIIEFVKGNLTENNIPRCICAICLDYFTEKDVFRRTACYHYFHSYCFLNYVEYVKKEASQQEVKQPNNDNNCEKSDDQVACPMCREPVIYDKEDLQNAPPPCVDTSYDTELSEEYKLQLTYLRKLYDKQQSQGGIIDVERERKKFLIRSISCESSDSTDASSLFPSLNQAPAPSISHAVDVVNAVEYNETTYDALSEVTRDNTNDNAESVDTETKTETESQSVISARKDIVDSQELFSQIPKTQLNIRINKILLGNETNSTTSEVADNHGVEINTEFPASCYHIETETLCNSGTENQMDNFINGKDHTPSYNKTETFDNSNKAICDNKQNTSGANRPSSTYLKQKQEYLVCVQTDYGNCKNDYYNRGTSENHSARNSQIDYKKLDRHDKPMASSFKKMSDDDSEIDLTKSMTFYSKSHRTEESNEARVRRNSSRQSQQFYEASAKCAGKPKLSNSNVCDYQENDTVKRSNQTSHISKNKSARNYYNDTSFKSSKCEEINKMTNKSRSVPGPQCNGQEINHHDRYKKWFPNCEESSNECSQNKSQQSTENVNQNIGHTNRYKKWFSNSNHDTLS